MRRWLVVVALTVTACGEVPPPSEQTEASPVDAGPYRCGPLTCAGCCSNNVCRTGEEQSACGYDGRACRECGRGTACVSPGTCVSIASDAGSNGPPFNPDAGMLTNPFTGGPLEPPTQKCIFIFGGYYCS
jgi:hypothetical protein